MDKKWLSLLVAPLLLGLTAHAEESVCYEAEKAILHGKNRIITEATASGWKAVGQFESAEDTVEFTITIPADGMYDLTLSSKGIGGNKINNVLVDGQQIGTFESIGTMFTASTLKGVLLSAGEHSVVISPSWGWMYLDHLTVSPSQGIDNSVYDVQTELINPNATENARKLYSYLKECYGKVTLSGQVCDKGLKGTEIQAIHQVTGKYPAILGLDMMDYTPSRRALGAANPTAVKQAIDFHQQGGIVTFCWHWSAPKQYILDGKDENGNPRWWGGFYTKNVTYDIAAVMNGADPEGKKQLDADIAGIAEQLLMLQDAGVPVLWRPLHEASGGWFWWGAQGPEACKQLWIYLYDQLTNVHGCNNLIWVWNGQAADWYPGDEYVDIIGEDIYAPAHAYNAQNAKFSELLEYAGENKIIALTENGVLFDIDSVVATNARWAWFNTWSGDFVQKYGKYSEAYTEKDILIKTYNSEHVITLDELPDLY